METTTITIQRYRTPDGKPTCCADAEAGQMCRFLGVRRYGLVSVCMLGKQRDIAAPEHGYTQPDDKCEVWA